MADSIYKWSTTAASNDAADSIINWRENQLPDTVNDSARAMMKRIAEWRDDLSGTLVTVGTMPDYMLTTNATFDTLANGRTVKARVHATNTLAATLNVNGLTPKSIRKFGVGGDIPIGVGDLQLGGVYTFTYSATANSGAGGWVVEATASGAGFAAGTALVFAQATAPVGWTKSTANDNKALRVVSGSTGGTAGGTLAFTAAFAAARAASDVALTQAQIPAHTHTQQGSFTSGNVSADHTHTQAGGFNSGTESSDHNHNFTVYGGDGGRAEGPGSNGTPSPLMTAGTGWRNQSHYHATYLSGQTGGISANHTHATTISGQTSSIGSGAAHNHTLDMNVAYVDVIVCTKD